MKLPKYSRLAISKHMDRPLFIVGIIISTIALACVVLRIVIPTINIDQTTVYFLLIGVIPWIVLFVAEFKGLGIELKKSKTGSTQTPPPPDQPQPGDELSVHAKRVIATLWKYQTKSFGDNHAQRFTFMLYPGSAGYADYIKGIGSLLEKQLIGIQADGQVLLSDSGIVFMRDDHPELHDYPDTYKFGET